MNKFVNVQVKALLTTDFLIEVEDSESVESIKKKAEKEVVLPNKYPQVLNKFLKQRMNLEVKGIDSLLQSWIVDNIEYIITDNESTEKE